MKTYIFYTSEGFTFDTQDNQRDNCQIIDWAKGNHPHEAFENLKRENPSLQELPFTEIMCQELADEKVFYISLSASTY